MTQTAQLLFKHPLVGSLVIDNGLEDAEWTYGLNTEVYPTYGGEVVQILSVYIDDLRLIGNITTYKQMEAIYKYFTSYLQVATQGASGDPNQGDSVSSTSYNLVPMSFVYPARDWNFKIYPKTIPGFHYGGEVVMPQWQLSCFVIDDSPDIDLIKNGLAALTVQNQNVPAGVDDQLTVNDHGVVSEAVKAPTLFSMGGDISPLYGDPNVNPFETYDPSVAAPEDQIKKYSDYYSSLIPFWVQGDLSSLTSGIGSRPNLVPDYTTRTGNKVKVPGTPKPSKSSKSPTQISTSGSSLSKLF